MDSALMFGLRGFDASAHGVGVDSDMERNFWTFYRSDPTVAACRQIVNGILGASQIELYENEEKADSNEHFLSFIQEAYAPLISSALDYVRVVGFVPCVIVPHEDGVNLKPVIPPAGSCQARLIMDENFEQKLVLLSRFSMTRALVPNAVVHAVNFPTMEGTPVSMMGPLMLPMARLDTITAAAVEDQVRKSRPVLFTQERHTGGGNSNTQNQIQDISMLMGSDGTDGLVREAAETVNSASQQALHSQVERAAAMNRLTRDSELGESANRDGLQGMRGGVLCLPRNHEVANMTHTELRQDVNAARAIMHNQISAAMGVPTSLLDPSSGTYRQEELATRVLNMELARMSEHLSEFFTTVYRHMYKVAPAEGEAGAPAEGEAGAPAKGGPARARKRRRRGGRAPPAPLTVRLRYEKHVSFEQLTQLARLDVFKTEYTATMMARTLGIYESGATERAMRTDEEMTARAAAMKGSSREREDTTQSGDDSDAAQKVDSGPSNAVVSQRKAAQ